MAMMHHANGRGAHSLGSGGGRHDVGKIPNVTSRYLPLPKTWRLPFKILKREEPKGSAPYIIHHLSDGNGISRLNSIKGIHQRRQPAIEIATKYQPFSGAIRNRNCKHHFSSTGDPICYRIHLSFTACRPVNRHCSSAISSKK